VWWLHAAQVIRPSPAPLPTASRRSPCNAKNSRDRAQCKMAKILTHRFAAALGQAVCENCASQAIFFPRLRSRGLL